MYIQLYLHLQGDKAYLLSLPSGSSQCTSLKHPVSCIEPGVATRFIHDILHVSMPFSQIFPPSLETPSRARASSCQAVGTTWFFSSCGGILVGQPSASQEESRPHFNYIVAPREAGALLQIYQHRPTCALSSEVWVLVFC